MEGQRALKENSNLDLYTYKPHIREFGKYSQDIFTVSNNVFIEKKNLMVEAKEGENTVYRKLTDKPAGEVSFDQLRRLEKRLPPDGKNDIPQAEIK